MSDQDQTPEDCEGKNNNGLESQEYVHISDFWQAYGLAELECIEGLEELKKKLIAAGKQLAEAKSVEEQREIISEVMRPIEKKIVDKIELIRSQLKDERIE